MNVRLDALYLFFLCRDTSQSLMPTK